MIDMGIIIDSPRALARAYKYYKEKGFTHMVILFSSPSEDATLPGYYPLLEKEYPGIIPAYTVIRDKVFKNLPDIQNYPIQSKKIFYQHTASESLHVATAYQLMLKAKDAGALYISFPHNKTLASGGMIHEGQISFASGLPGISSLSEEVIVARDLELARGTGAQLHFHQISSKRSVTLIREAKNHGLSVTCGTSAGHLLFTHEKCQDFNFNFKYLPPLREETDRQALIEGIKDQTIDVLSTGHFSPPRSEEKLSIPFTSAPFTSLTLSDALPLLEKGILSSAEITNLVINNPRRILGLNDSTR